jgi:TetR/AcrR family transcriptional regulator, transcriptional repressor for nem operon
MSRTKEFQPDQAVHKAMLLFWKQGYEATSMQTLTDTIDLSRSSLYDTFGDKHALFIRALDMYRDHMVTRMRRSLGTAPLHEVVAALFDTFIDDEKGHERGCFMVNSVAELAPHDEMVTLIATRYSTEIRTLLAEHIRTAQEEGTLRSHFSPEALALFLFNNFQGLRVLLKAVPSSHELRMLRDVTLSVLS